MKVTTEQTTTIVVHWRLNGAMSRLTMDEAKQLHADLAEAIRAVEHEAVRVKVTWADRAIEESIVDLAGYRDAPGYVAPAPDSATVAVAIDCMRAVLL